jgi:hypothetical protein
MIYSPLITTYRNDVETVMAAAKLLFVLSRPPDPASPTVGEQIEYLQQYKESILDSDVIAVFVVLLAETLGVEPELREPISVQRCDLLLWLLRNLLAVPDPAPSDDPVRDPLTRLHDRMLRLLQQEHFLPLFVFVCESLAVTETGGGDQWALLLVEMLFYILRTESPESLMQARRWRAGLTDLSTVAAATTSSKTATSSPSSSVAPELEELLQRTKREKRVALASLPARHSNWGGKIVMPVGGGADKSAVKMMNTGAAVASASSGGALPPMKPLVKVTKKARAQQRPLSRLSDETRGYLADMCEQLLAVGYAKLMQAFKLAMARDTRESLNQIDDRDRAKYVWLISLFTGYHTLLQRERLAGVPADVVARWSSGELEFAERHERPVFYIDAIGTTYHRLDVKFVINSISWFANEHKYGELCFALDAFDRILQTAQLLLVSLDADNRRVAQSIIKSAYYDFLEDSTRSLHSLIINFKPSTQPFVLLLRLISAAHTYLKLLSLTSKTGERVFAKVKQRKRSKKPKQPDEAAAAATDAAPVDDGFVVADTEPIDGERPAATAEPELGADDAEVCAQVEQFLAQRQSEGVVGIGAMKAAGGKYAPLARAWSAELQFHVVRRIERLTRGAADDESTAAERIATVRDLLGANKPLPTPASVAAQARAAENVNGDDDNDDDDDDEDGGGGDGDDDMRVIQREISLDDQVRKFAHGNVVQNYCVALERWQDLPADTVHAIVKMFQRLAVDAKTPALFWQGTVLRLFQVLVDNPLISRSDPKFADLLRFVDYALEMLFAKLRDEPEQAGQLALEMLFSRARSANSMWSGTDDPDADARLHRAGASRERDRLRSDATSAAAAALRGTVRERTVQRRVVRESDVEWTEEENAKLMSYFVTFGDAPDTVSDVISAMLDDASKTAPLVYEQLLKLKLLKRDDVPAAAAAVYEADLSEAIDVIEHYVDENGGNEATTAPTASLPLEAAEIVAPPALDSLEGRDEENGLAILMHRLLERALEQYRERVDAAAAAAAAGEDKSRRNHYSQAPFNPSEAYRWLALQLQAAARRRPDDNETAREAPLYTINVLNDVETAKWLLPRAPMRPLLHQLHLRATADDKLAVYVLRGVGGNQLRRYAELLLQSIDDCNAEQERARKAAMGIQEEEEEEEEQQQEDDEQVADAVPDESEEEAEAVFSDDEEPTAKRSGKRKTVDEDDNAEKPPTEEEDATAKASAAAKADAARRKHVKKMAKKREARRAAQYASLEEDQVRQEEDNADESEKPKSRKRAQSPVNESAPLAVFAKSRTDALAELRKRKQAVVDEPYEPLPLPRRMTAPPQPPVEEEAAAVEESVPAVQETLTENVDAEKTKPQPPTFPSLASVLVEDKSVAVAAEAGEEDRDNANTGANKKRRLKRRAIDDDDD